MTVKESTASLSAALFLTKDCQTLKVFKSWLEQAFIQLHLDFT